MKTIKTTITYRELAKRVGDAVLNNEIIEFAYTHDMNVELENGSFRSYYDGNGKELTEEEFEAAQNIYTEEDDEGNIKFFDGDDNEITEEEYNALESAYESENEIFQYYIISDCGAEYLKDRTNEIVFYIDELDMYLWGITHWGTSWDGVDVEVEEYDFT